MGQRYLNGLVSRCTTRTNFDFELTGGLGGGEGHRVEELKIKGLGTRRFVVADGGGARASLHYDSQSNEGTGFRRTLFPRMWRGGTLNNAKRYLASCKRRNVTHK